MLCSERADVPARLIFRVLVSRGQLDFGPLANYRRFGRQGWKSVLISDFKILFPFANLRGLFGNKKFLWNFDFPLLSLQKRL